MVESINKKLLMTSGSALAADRPVIRRAVLIAALGNYTHPTTRHSIAQYLLAGLCARAVAHDTALRAEVERRVKRAEAAHRNNDPSALTLYQLTPPVAPSPFTLVREARGWSTQLSFLVDTLPPKGHAARRQSNFSPNAYPYVMVDATLYQPKLLMNVSGSGVRVAAHLAQVRVPQDILVLHDELSRAFGKVSIKDGGSAAGHNGVRSVQDSLQCTKRGFDVARVRIGIDRPPPGGDVSRWVLGEMPREQLSECEWPPVPPATGHIVELVWAQVAAWCSRTTA